jgi:hypothetical protein
LRLQTLQKRKERVRLSVGGDRLDYSGDVATSTADITTFKILVNSTLSTADAAMMMMNIKNYYLGTPLLLFEYIKMLLSRFPEEIVNKCNLNALAIDGWVYIEIRKGMYGLKQAGLLANQLLQACVALPQFEYMKILLSHFPEEIVQTYNLNALAVDGWVYIEIRKGMYGLKQAGLFANQLLQTRLAPFGYCPACHTPGLWLHRTRSISFTRVVDDFAVKYVEKQHTEHLRDTLLRTYELTTDWTATVYSGMTLKWDYKAEHEICPCPVTFQTCSANFNMKPPSIRNTPHPGMSRPSTAPRPNMQRQMKHRHSRPSNVS